MSPFPDPLEVEYLDNGLFRLLRPFRYRDIVCQEGMFTDFGSIPKLAHSVISPIGVAGKPYVIHDGLYQHHGFGRYSQRQCDIILLNLLKQVGVNFITRQTIYLHLRMWGWTVWRKTRHERNEAMAEKGNITNDEVAAAPTAIATGPPTALPAGKW